MTAKEKDKRPLWRKVLFSFVCSLLLLALVLFVSFVALLQPPAAGDVVTLNIASGATIREIATELERAGLVQNDNVFWLYLQFKNEGANFKAGQYTLKVGLDRGQLIEALNAGGVSVVPTVRLTIPEGLTVRQLATRVEQKFGIKDERFLLEAESMARLTDDELIYPLEGYLFPDTYEFRADVDEHAILKEILQQFDERLEQLPNGWEQQLDKLGLSLHEMLTVASLIEREVVVPEERKLVASVIYNRLRTGMRLQIDATVQYLLPAQKDRLLYEDLKLQSPYNTYVSDGLPPGPISNPGLAAMEAALYPATSEYLFYTTKNDGTKAHYFGKTYNEHLRNIAKSRR